MRKQVTRGVGSALLAALLAALGCFAAPAPAANATPPVPAVAASATTWDEAATRETRAFVETALHRFETMDVEGLKTDIAKRAFLMSFDLDLENRPVRMRTHEEAIAYCAGLFDELKKSNAKLKLAIRSIDCHATTNAGFCAAEYDVSAALSDGKIVSQPSRTTIALAREDGAWKWAQWHTSLAVLPAPEPATAPGPGAATPAPRTGH